MGEHRGRHHLDVVRLDEVAALDEGPRLRDPQEREARTGLAPRNSRVSPPGCAVGRRRRSVQALFDEDVLGAPRSRRARRRARDRSERLERRVGRLLGEHPRLLRERRIADRDAHREAVELRLGERVRALVLDRVLRRHDHEREAELVRDAVDRDLALLHALEQRRLGLRRRAVDLVDEEDVREDRPGPELELVRALVEDVDAGDVGRKQVRRELEPREASSRPSGRAPWRASSSRRPESPR